MKGRACLHQAVQHQPLRQQRPNKEDMKKLADLQMFLKRPVITRQNIQEPEGYLCQQAIRESQVGEGLIMCTQLFPDSNAAVMTVQASKPSGHRKCKPTLRHTQDDEGRKRKNRPSCAQP